MKVGIDLSSTNTGLGILSDDNKLIFHGNFQLWDSNRFTIACNVSDMLDCVRFKNINNELISIGVELADFKNANITNRFNLLAGMIINELWHSNLPLMVDDFKLFNSNEWQQHLGLKPSMERQFTKSNCLEYQDTWTEDECDAYCIAYFLPQLRDRTQMHQEVKEKKIKTTKSKVQKWKDKANRANKIRKLEEIVNKYKFIAIAKPLTKAQQRALEKAEKELKELENEKTK